MTPEDELTTEQLKQLVREKDERIAELENEVAMMDQRLMNLVKGLSSLPAAASTINGKRNYNELKQVSRHQ